TAAAPIDDATPTSFWHPPAAPEMFADSAMIEPMPPATTSARTVLSGSTLRSSSSARSMPGTTPPAPAVGAATITPIREFSPITDRAYSSVKAELYALSVMGENSRMGVIVAAPTAGAGGVVPGMLLALEEERSVDPERTVRALVVAGGIGSIIALSANISGAAGGCQNEVGVASSMGAAAVAYMMGGTTRQSIHAAALALKNTLGLVCDPVGGLVEVPCVKRNALFAVHGLTAAQLALAGVESVIPMDEVVEAMVRIGRALPRGLRETAEGGLATTATGCAIGTRLKDEANQRRAERAAERERIAQERKTTSAS